MNERTATGAIGTIGIVGAGKSGVAIARLALAAGYAVRIASSGTARATALLTDIVSPGARAVEVADVADGADVVVVAVPLRRFRELPAQLFRGRIVIDAMNYWPPIDGTLPEFEDSDLPSSVLVQDALPSGTPVVKTFNHLGYHQLEDLARPPGHHERVALGIAGDDPAAARLVAGFVAAVGFDPVLVGPLARSGALQPGGPLFGAALSAAAVHGAVGALLR